jgi:hypothetical protein
MQDWRNRMEVSQEVEDDFDPEFEALGELLK